MDEITAGAVWRSLPRRDPAGHKGMFGKVMCLCGCVGFTGAPVKPTQPHRHITLPNMPLCPAGSRRGRLRQTAPAVISSIRPPPFLYTPIV